MPTSTPTLIVEPDDGLGPVHEFIETTETSLLIKQFMFTEENLIRAVIERKSAGVDVRVMLNPKRSGGDRVNDETYDRFNNAGINVKWSSPKFYVTHEKVDYCRRKGRARRHLQPLSQAFFPYSGLWHCHA